MKKYTIFSITTTILLSCIALIAGVDSYNRATEILRDHSLVEAPISNAEHKVEYLSNGKKKDVYEISYAYQIGETEYVGKFNTSEHNFTKIKSNGFVEVAYSNSNLRRFDRFDVLQKQADLKGLAIRFSLIFASISGFFLIVGLVIKMKKNNQAS